MHEEIANNRTITGSKGWVFLIALIMKNARAMCLVALIVMATAFLPSHVEGRIIDTNETVLSKCFPLKDCNTDFCRENCALRGYDKDQGSCVSYKGSNCCCAKGRMTPR
uniref:Uncharacterized protein n=1 Tax=Avena sativa TaxID=4498 RepID=A0ACD6ACN5_AVESA